MNQPLNKTKVETTKGPEMTQEATQAVGSSTLQKDGSSLWEVRTEEQSYAFLPDQEIQEENRYGQKIDLLDLTEGKFPEGRSMFINENPDVGINPNRNKQHAFFFTADNCIGCHACESACAEKNDTPAHLAFRSVGYVEGGSFPDYQRLNISMACNHCDDPVCLRGCPTGAYTKHTEYGAVLQDPETCFGCGYCTWVCPYNAPQLDPLEGQVSKCNMCVDRLEMNLKPACVSACVGNALDFGVVENIPENREEAKVSIPGFPDPEITHPNIRFQQVKTLPDEMTRPDSMPIKYHKDTEGNYKPSIDQKVGKKKSWNLGKLNSRENPLVLFTLMCQASIGAFTLIFLAAQFGIAGFTEFVSTAMYVPLAIFSFLLVGSGLFMSTTHLGKPLKFYRGFNNLRYSPVCREGLGIAAFMGFLALHIAFSLPANSVFSGFWQVLFGTEISTLLPATFTAHAASVCGYLAIFSAAIGLYYMTVCYRIPARPFWNHWQVSTTFYGSGLSLGALVIGLFTIPTLAIYGIDIGIPLQILGAILAFGTAVEGVGLYFHHKDMSTAEHEGGASHYIQRSTFGKTYILRNVLLGAVTLGATMLVVLGYNNIWGVSAWGVIALGLVAASLIGRALFYVLVIPTTMPGAFFWRNKGFEQHARDIGLANMPQVGVVPNLH